MAIVGKQGDGTAAGPEVPEAVRKLVDSGKSPDVIFEPLILGPWVRVPAGSPRRPTRFGRPRARGGGASHALPPKSLPNVADRPNRHLIRARRRFELSHGIVGS